MLNNLHFLYHQPFEPVNSGAAGKAKSIMAINALNFPGESTKKILRMDSGNANSPSKGQGIGANITPRGPNMTDKKMSHKALSKMFGVDPTKSIGSTGG